jgi:hypothetical protein
MDFLELQMSDAKEVAEMLAGLKTFNFQVNKEIIPKEDNHVML